jgi:hypothetical protein
LQVSILKQRELPDIWVAAGEHCPFLERYIYVLSDLPSKGLLTDEHDRAEIKVLVVNFDVF